METRKLEHLIELAATGSFSRAASNLHLTQSALSKSIQSLEAELGGQLIDRRGRRCVMTSAGELVLDRARVLLAGVADLAELARDDAAPEGTLRVGFGAGPGATMTSDFIAHVVAAYPRVRLLTRHGTVQVLLGALRERSIDAIVIDVRSLTACDDLRVDAVGSLESGAVCRVGHPLTMRPAVAFKDILEFPVLTTAVSDEVARWCQERYGKAADPRKFTTVESEQLEPLIAAVTRSDAIFIGVLAAAREWVAAGKVRPLEIDLSLDLAVPIALVQLVTRGETRLVRILRRFAMDWFANLSLAKASPALRPGPASRHAGRALSQ